MGGIFPSLVIILKKRHRTLFMKRKHRLLSRGSNASSIYSLTNAYKKRSYKMSYQNRYPWMTDDLRTKSTINNKLAHDVFLSPALKSIMIIELLPLIWFLEHKWKLYRSVPITILMWYIIIQYIKTLVIGSLRDSKHTVFTIINFWVKSSLNRSLCIYIHVVDKSILDCFCG